MAKRNPVLLRSLHNMTFDSPFLSDAREGVDYRLLSIFTWMPSCTSLRKKYRSTSASTMLLAKLMVRVSSKLAMAQFVREEKGCPI